MFTLRTLAATAALAITATSVSAQVPCTMRTDLIKVLGEKYGEAQSAYGTSGEKAVVEIYVSEKGSFTILSTSSNGVSCIIAAGQNWEAMELPKKLTAL